MTAKYIRAFVKSNKIHYVDAETIAEAVQRPAMRFVVVGAAFLRHQAKGALIQAVSIMLARNEACSVFFDIPSEAIRPGPPQRALSDEIAPMLSAWSGRSE